MALREKRGERVRIGFERDGRDGYCIGIGLKNMSTGVANIVTCREVSVLRKRRTALQALSEER